SRRRHTRFSRDWSSDVCSSDLSNSCGAEEGELESWSHTVSIGGQDQSEPRDRMSWQSAANAKCLSWASTPALDLVQGEHDGYQQIGRASCRGRVGIIESAERYS